MRLLPVLVLLSLALVPARAQDYANRVARGLAIYKSHAFDADTSAVLVEYLSHQDHAAVTYFVTMNGSRVTVPNKTAEVLFVPYPGKGETTADTALVLLDVAAHRFPQYKKHLEPLVAAWKQEARRPKAEVEAEVKRRNDNEEKAAKTFADIKSQQPPPKQPDPGPSLLKPLPGQKAAPTPAEPAPAEPEKPAPDLQKTLQNIQDYLGGQSGNP